MIKNKVILKKIIILLFTIVIIVIIYQKFIKKDFISSRLQLEGTLYYIAELPSVDYKEGSLFKYHNKICNEVELAGKTNHWRYDFNHCTKASVIQNIKKLYTLNSNLFELMETYEKECNNGDILPCRFFSTLVYFADNEKLEKYIKHTKRNFSLTQNIHNISPVYNPITYNNIEFTPAVLSACIKDKLERLGYKFTSKEKCTGIFYLFPLIKQDIYSKF